MPPSLLRDPGFFGGVSHPKSFLQALAGSTSSFPDLKRSTFRGLPALLVSDDEIRALAEPFRFSLVGFFPGKRPPLDAIRKFFFNLKLKGDVSVTVLDSTHILIKLENDLDYCRIFCHRSYLIFNCFLKITKWTPNLDIGVESPTIPIWISFPHLRPHFFAPRILFGLGELFGKPLKIDEATSVGSRPSIARVLVEIDITKNYPKLVWLGSDLLGYAQEVVFDDFPHFCDVCKKLGHISGKCSSDLAPASVAERPVEIHLGGVNDNKGVNDDVVNVDEVTSVGKNLRSVDPVGCATDIGLPQENLDGSVDLHLGIGAPLAAEKSSLSPFALPFDPVLDGGVRQGMILESSAIAVVTEINKDNKNVDISDNLPSNDLNSFGAVKVTEVEEGGAGVDLFAGVEPSRVVVLSPSLIVEEGTSVVEIPVKAVDAHVLADLVGKYSGKEIREQNNWLNDSSEDSDFSESDNDFSLARSSIASRGKFWGRGRRKR
ncbi:hypothetical protein KFK09_027089 [Dendrobium nobile]|uniref:DUF4283 domain-containing protein n=1 Tax=Dendrobium nobile TaxID=94219 RepID=A0A8T3A9Q3_DENNO|nr:hypothetical protein KFK09_027089 [Dendrobium nobile]